MVQEIEDFRLELQLDPLTQLELTPQCQINLRHPKTSKIVIAECSLPELGWYAERSSVNSPAARHRRIAKVNRHTGNQIRALQFDNQIFADNVGSDDNVDGRSCSSAHDGVKR